MPAKAKVVSPRARSMESAALQASSTPQPEAATSTEPNLADLPVRVDRRGGAAIVTRYFFPVSHRSLEAWPLPVRHVNGKATIATADLVALAREKLNAAPTLMGGRRSAAVDA
ncbi:MAG: hypothetical protein M0Z28_10240 [Rhodospirillales bacterium]|nr:hypothetical protein [Rhodospirillales bacterium]